VTNLNGGTYFFSLYSQDSHGRISSTVTFPISLAPGSIVTVSGIILAPTIDVDKSEVRRGDDITVFGISQPNAKVSIMVGSNGGLNAQTSADPGGAYLWVFNTISLDLGDHSARSKATISEGTSDFSHSVGFLVGNRNVYKQEPACNLRADLNGDCRVNLVDFSIMAYWYRRPAPPALVDLISDGIIDLRDFSVLAYYWTG
jgi:hypothetical protein